MSAYTEYLDAKSDLVSKEWDFKNAVEEWFNKHEDLSLQSIDMVKELIMDHFTITTDEKFKKYLTGFEETFTVKCTRIHHQEILVPGERTKHVWKFHFREKKPGDERYEFQILY
jgi:hypothetical protein